ncbi:MAG TPA: GxxExxY protein [Verrucomicrobiae bacterium]|nr:GxxExxY protein [Verrucomicrobiae bacterium]
MLLKGETKAILGCAFDVLNEVGPGFHEKIYENSLTVAFRQKGIHYDQQCSFPVLFRGELVGEFIPDLLAFNAVIVDTKVVEHISDHDRGQMLNYLRVTRKRVGLILNFKQPRLGWERLVL